MLISVPVTSPVFYPIAISIALHIIAAISFHSFDEHIDYMAEDKPALMKPISLGHITIQTSVQPIPHDPPKPNHNDRQANQKAQHPSLKKPPLKAPLKEQPTISAITNNPTPVKQATQPDQKPSALKRLKNPRQRSISTPKEQQIQNPNNPAPTPEEFSSLAKNKAPSQQKVTPDSSYYYDLANAIEKNKYYPIKAKKRGQEGKVVIEISLLKDGRITQIKIITSSGIPTLDRAAYQAVKKIRRFKPLPDSLALSSVSVQIPIQFKLI